MYHHSFGIGRNETFGGGILTLDCKGWRIGGRLLRLVITNSWKGGCCASYMASTALRSGTTIERGCGAWLDAFLLNTKTSSISKESPAGFHWRGSSPKSLPTSVGCGITASFGSPGSLNAAGPERREFCDA